MKPIIGNGVSDFDGIEDRVVDRLRASALRDKSIGLGSGRDGTAAGKLAAVYVDVDLTAHPDLANVDIGHALGRKPTMVELVGIANAALTTPPTVSIMHVSPEKWTATNARVAVTITGTQAGTVLKFRVGGE